MQKHRDGASEAETSVGKHWIDLWIPVKSCVIPHEVGSIQSSVVFSELIAVLWVFLRHDGIQNS